MKKITKRDLKVLHMLWAILLGAVVLNMLQASTTTAPMLHPNIDVPGSTITARKLRNFTEILIDSGSDKYDRHHYERYYEEWLEPIRSKPNISFMEIGAQAGKSMTLWNEYFYNHPQKLLGLAYSYKSNTEGLVEKVKGMDKVTIQFGDQSSYETMASLRGQGPWDVIIDDGSHVPSHMIFCLFSLWNSIKPGGLYIIEDLETNYWLENSRMYEYNLTGTGIDAPPETSAVAKIQQIQHVLVRNQIGTGPKMSIMPGDEDICSIEWGMNLVMLKKCKAGTLKPPVQKKLSYNVTQMEQWITHAKKSNPSITSTQT